MVVEIFVVSSVQVEGGFRPEAPKVFGSRAAGEADLMAVMRDYWAGLDLHMKVGEMPDSWSEAQKVIAEQHTDGSWCWYTLTPHQIPRHCLGSTEKEKHHDVLEEDDHRHQRMG